MAQKRIVVDSNSYFRLAQNIHPLLCQPFGQEDLTLYILGWTPFFGQRRRNLSYSGRDVLVFRGRLVEGQW